MRQHNALCVSALLITRRGGEVMVMLCMKDGMGSHQVKLFFL